MHRVYRITQDKCSLKSMFHIHFFLKKTWIFLLFYISFNCAHQCGLKCIWKLLVRQRKICCISLYACGILKHYNKKAITATSRILYFIPITCTLSLMWWSNGLNNMHEGRPVTIISEKISLADFRRNRAVTPIGGWCVGEGD